MKKTIILLCLLVLTFVSYSQSQYTPMTATGYQEKRLKVDSSLHIPSFCGVPTLRNSTAIQGAIAMDTCNNKLYKWTRAAGWSEVSGGGGGSQDLQSVLDSGNFSYNKDINLYGRTSQNQIYLSGMDNNYMPFMALADSIGGGIYQYTYPQTTIEFINKNMSQKLKQQDSIRAIIYLPSQTTDATDTIAKLSDVRAVNGNSNDTTSLSNRINLKLNISDTATMLNPYARKAEISPIDTSNKFINNIVRIAGKDSIIFYKGSSRFAIKDSVGTNPAPVGYYGAFDDSTTQSAAVINTAYPIKLNRTTLSNAVTIANNGSGQPTRITINNSGIYNIQFSLQLEKTGGSGNMTADIWLRENGIDVPNSTGKVVLTGSANASPVIASWNYVINVVGGYYYELMWSTSNVNVEIVASVASSPHPAIPSAILTVTQQSGIMAGTGITAMNGLTGAVQTFAVDSSNSTFKITSTGTSHKFNIPDAATSGVTRGLISNTQYNTFNSKIGAGDTATMLTPYLRKADTTAMLSKYFNLNGYGLSKSGQVISVDSATLSTKYVRISDTTTMLSKYLRKSDTTSLSTRIDAKGYGINLGCILSNFAASTTYYFGTPVVAASTTQSIRRIYIPQSGTIKSGYIYAKTTGTTSTENWTLSIRLNATTSTTFATVANASTDKVFSNTGLNIAVVAGDYIEIITTTPAWTTAAGNTTIYGTIIIQ